MAYKKQTWVDDETVGTADRFNHMEAGIEEAGKTGGVEVGTIVYIEDDAEVPEGYEEVSDDGGIVTVTNDNGTAIKFPDGTMICTKRVKLSNININQAWGSCYISDVIGLGNFAESFKESPIATHTVQTGTACWVMSAEWATTTYCGGIRLIRATSVTNVEAHINIVAVGRWK